MATSYRTPGVYREDVYVRAAAKLPTGVPGFVGFGSPRATGGPVLAPLRRTEDLARQFVVDAQSYLPQVVSGFFANGGELCYVVTATPGGGEQALREALEKLRVVTDLDLVAVPDAMLLTGSDARRVQSAAIVHCATHGDRFAILDGPGGQHLNAAVPDPTSVVKGWRVHLTVDADQSAYAALYFPWIKVATAEVGASRVVPPCGHLAGVYARSDARVGVFKAPANEELLDILDLECPVSSSLQETFNPDGINCLRAFSGRGMRVWGARTLSGDASWRYIHVKRLFITLTRWIDRTLTWAAFEPNTPRLWLRIQREINGYLNQWFAVGALKGASPAEAYFVKCDAETNPVAEREVGRVTTEIGLAPALPAEFIVVRIVHRAGSAQAS